MHRTKKMVVATTAVTLLMAGVSSAMAASNNPNKTTICHATGSTKHPYQRITVSNNALDAHRNHQDGRDIIPAPEGGCPNTPPPGSEDHEVTVCHFTGDEDHPYERFHFEKGEDIGDHADHEQDLISPDDLDKISCPGALPDDGDDDDNGSCSAESNSGNSTVNQDGPINIAVLNNLHADNALANLACGAEIGKNVNVLGKAIFGGDADAADTAGDDCSVESTSGDSSVTQDDGLNISVLNNLHADNAVANLACGAEIGKNVNVLGVAMGSPSLGGSSLGSGVLSGGPAGLLSGADYLLYGLDVNVLAKILVIF